MVLKKKKKKGATKYARKNSLGRRVRVGLRVEGLGFRPPSKLSTTHSGAGSRVQGVRVSG